MLSATAINASIHHGIKGKDDDYDANNVPLKGFRKKRSMSTMKVASKKTSLQSVRKSVKVKKPSIPKCEKGDPSERLQKKIESDNIAALEGSLIFGKDIQLSHDIVSGRGGDKAHSESHQAFLDFKDKYHEPYNRKPYNRAVKQYCLYAVIDWVESNGGRFLIKIVGSVDTYRLMTIEERDDKIKQALREERKVKTDYDHPHVPDERDDDDDDEIAVRNDNYHPPEDEKDDPSIAISNDDNMSYDDDDDSYNAVSHLLLNKSTGSKTENVLIGVHYGTTVGDMYDGRHYEADRKIDLPYSHFYMDVEDAGITALRTELPHDHQNNLFHDFVVTANLPPVKTDIDCDMYNPIDLMIGATYDDQNEEDWLNVCTIIEETRNVDFLRLFRF